MGNAAVITADIANYTGLSTSDQQKLIGILSVLAKQHKLEFYRGDSFQVYLKHPQEALKLLLKMRTAAKGINQASMVPVSDIRASIGIGLVNIPVKTISTATGEAFILSGRSFDGMLKSDQQLVIQAGIPSISPALRLIASFVDYLLSQLTSKQAEVVFELLNNHTQIETARKLNKSQATINQHLQSAAWTEIEKLLDEYEQLTSQLQ
jgi:hypothetical protein